MEYKIENDVPIPEKARTGRGRKYPWESMNVGDSIAFEAAAEYERARSASNAYARNHKGVKFTARQTLNGNYRIWRVK